MIVAAPRVTESGDGISAIDTDLLRPSFDASHLILEGDRAAFVDTGVNSSVPLLLATLEQKNVDVSAVEYVFLTHVHLDHAGGAGMLMRALPNAMAVLHPRGAPHMIDPTKLIKGATAVYGEQEYRRQYGDIVAIPEQKVIVVDDNQEFELAGRTLQIMFTEGHARHHYCLSDPTSSAVFTGDSFGVSYRELDTENGEFIYPTTTPVHFDPPEAHRAIDRIMGAEPSQLFLTHYSKVSDLPRLADDMHERIDKFISLAEKVGNQNNRTRRLNTAMLEYLQSEIRAHGFSGSNEEIEEVIHMDVILNSMGIEFWLDHR